MSPHAGTQGGALLSHKAEDAFLAVVSCVRLCCWISFLTPPHCRHPGRAHHTLLLRTLDSEPALAAVPRRTSSSRPSANQLPKRVLRPPHLPHGKRSSPRVGSMSPGACYNLMLTSTECMVSKYSSSCMIRVWRRWQRRLRGRIRRRL